MNEFAVDWLGRAHPYLVHYGFWLVLGLLFLKNLMFFGAILPGAAVLVAAGSLAREGQASPYLLALAGFLGTVGGDCVSYAIGRKAGDRLLQSRRWGKVIVSVSERVRKEPAVIVFCHFETILRMLVPAAAGMSGVPFRRWLVLNTTGVTFWIACYIGIGYFFPLSGALAAGKTIGLVVVGVLVVFVAVHYFRGRSARPQETAVSAK